MEGLASNCAWAAERWAALVKWFNLSVPLIFIWKMKVTQGYNVTWDIPRNRSVFFCRSHDCSELPSFQDSCPLRLPLSS